MDSERSPDSQNYVIADLNVGSDSKENILLLWKFFVREKIYPSTCWSNFPKSSDNPTNVSRVPT